jgi:hypothetical protein
VYEYIDKLREGIDNPPSVMAIIRKALSDAESRIGKPEMPKLFSAEECDLFHRYAECLDGFLATDDAKDALKLVVDTFVAFIGGPDGIVATPGSEGEADASSEVTSEVAPEVVPSPPAAVPAV